ncbi:MAG: GH32 C-terminal domain-containing protein [Verrucomicrobiota bacterium]
MKRTLFAALVITAFCGASGQANENDKTLVSWLTLADKSVTGGSAITLQWRGHFDGIIFAEKEETKWAVGSDGWKRSEKNQESYPIENAGPDELIQMVAVYQGRNIKLYRNAVLIADYDVEEESDFITKNDNHVVIGVRHSSSNGSIAGSIDDARIYDQGLTLDQIKALKVNEASTIKPYAWWNFEEGNAEELTGQFPFHYLAAGAEVKDGKLVLMRKSTLTAAKDISRSRWGSEVPYKKEPYQPETPEWPEVTPDNWPIYHLAHPHRSTGPYDPNSAIYHKGRYHLHYIYREQEGFVLGHVSSSDMVNWKWHPTVLAPRVNGHGMFSGTAFFTKEGTVAHTYCGWGSNRNWIQHALDDNLDSWSQPEVMLPKDKDGKVLKNEKYFDPDIWIMNGQYYGLNARSSSEPPVIMKSDNLKDWELIGELLHPDFDEQKLGVRRNEDISCPNFFKLGDKWVLVCISHGLGCRYFIGDFVNEQFLPEHHAVLGGSSNRYFAPESLKAADGRRVNWSWYRGDHYLKSIQSLPTELELPDDGVMRIRPIVELEQLRYDEKVKSNIVVKANTPTLVEGPEGDHMEIKINIQDTGDQSFGVKVLCDEQGDKGLIVRVNREKKQLEVGIEHAPFELNPGEPLELRVFVDATLVEVFANEKQIVMSSIERKEDDPINDSIFLLSEGNEMKVDKVTTWQMKSTYHKVAE